MGDSEGVAEELQGRDQVTYVKQSVTTLIIIINCELLHKINPVGELTSCVLLTPVYFIMGLKNLEIL